MNKPALIALVCFCLGGILWWRSVPESGEDIIRKMKLSETQITYNGVVYEATWKPEVSEYAGDLRAVLQDHNKLAPFNTHILVLTSGSFSDPNQVAISEDGKITLQPAKNLKDEMTGNIQLLHVVPSDRLAYRKLEALKVGQKLTITGRPETDGRVTDDKGTYIQFANDGTGRTLLLLDEIKLQ